MDYIKKNGFYTIEYKKKKMCLQLSNQYPQL